MMDRSRSKGDYFRTLERRISDLQKQVDVLINRDQAINWIAVGSSGAPAFGAGWSNYGSGWDTASFAKDSAGNVHLRGLLIGVPSSTIFVLPEGYRPSGNRMFAVDAGGSHSRLDVYPTGAVLCITGDPTGYYSICCMFRPG